MSTFTAVNQPTSLNDIGDSRAEDRYEPLSQFSQIDDLAYVKALVSPADASPTGSKRRRSHCIVSDKRRKGNPLPGSADHSDQDVVEDATVVVPLRAPSPRSSLSESTYREGSASLLPSLSSEDDFLGLKYFLVYPIEPSHTSYLTNGHSSTLLTPPATEYNSRSSSIFESTLIPDDQTSLGLLHSHSYNSTETATGISDNSPRDRDRTVSPDAALDYGQSNNRFPPEFWFPSPLNPPLPSTSPKLPGYSFVSLPPLSNSDNEHVSTENILMQLLTNEPEHLTQDNPALSRGHAVPEKSLLNIKLRPITRGRSRALPSKELPPFYVPILPSALAWALVEGADPDSEDEELATDEVALRTAKHLAGLRVLKRNVTRFQKEQEGRGRIVQDSTDDELLQEYLTAVTKMSTKKVAFDDSAARIVLADWKGIPVEDL